jgi:hypothetical protein
MGYPPVKPHTVAGGGRRAAGAPHSFKFFLLGGDPEWQVLHGRPFAIAGVACACCAAPVPTTGPQRTTLR